MEKVEIKTKVLNENQRLAEELRERFRSHGVLVLNFISSPGSGKTELLERTLASLPPNTKVAVLTGDIQTDNDARRLARYGFPVRQITTGGTCHLDGRMINRGLDELAELGSTLESLDLLFIENIGNLVCPASYDLGEESKIVLLSVTEGEDKPLKYPSIFHKASLFLMTKIDLLPYVPFNADAAEANARTVHPAMEVIRCSSTAAGGLDTWIAWLEKKMKAAREAALTTTNS
jgi:hydrogenase nickel incorporation protein HypB